MDIFFSFCMHNDTDIYSDKLKFEMPSKHQLFLYP